MALFDDGSYSCTPGIALIAKVLAGRCPMEYTKVTVGEGEISEEQTPQTMQEVAGYVMDGKIAAITNPVNGECQVTVQINSSDVERGFYCTGILLWAKDPDLGDVPYTYLVLENGPEWIRPKTSAVGKLATFDLIAAVGAVDKVTATIDPNSIVTREVVEQLIAEATLKRELTIPKEGWDVGAEEAPEGTMYVDIPQGDTTPELVPLVSVTPSDADKAKECGMFLTARALDGKIRLYAVKAPTAEIKAELVLMQATPGEGEENGGYGFTNAPGASGPEVKKAIDDAAAARKAAEDAMEAITNFTQTINAVPSQSGTLTYNGGPQSPSWNNYDTKALKLSGTTTGTDADTYEATFTPNEHYEWASGGSDPKTVQWIIGRASTSTPQQTSIPTYTGSELTPTWTGYEEDKVDYGGVKQATNAGSYNAEFTPKKNYQFGDGTTGMKTVPWKINKAAGSLTLDKEAVTLSGGTKEMTVNATRAGDGVVSAVSNHSEYASVQVTGTAIKITAVKSGSAVITVSCAAGTNHNQAPNKTINVTVNLPDPDLSKNGPSAIKEAAQSGQAANLWSEGDKVPITISNKKVGALTINGTFYAVIIGFNHNSGIEGNNSIHFQFGKNASGTDIAFVDSDYPNTGSSDGFRMNTSNTNTGGWEQSYMRKTICAQFLAALPTDWQNIITACTKYSDNKGAATNTAACVTATQDKIWLLAEYEAFGQIYYANSAEQNYQKQYDFYKNGNSRVKYKHSDTGTACYWWLRSVNATSTNGFRDVYTDGSSGGYSAGNSLGFAPGFKVS
jgi:hypothetical protein